MNTRTFDGCPLTPGLNVDAIDVAAGVQETIAIGYDSPTHVMIAEYALIRWARGEEEGAFRNMVRDGGIDLTSAYRVVAAARAATGAQP